MPSYTLVVLVHIAAAVLLLSTSVVGEPIVRAAVRRATSAAGVRALLTVARPLALLSPVAAMLLLASGIYLTSVAHVWTLGWVQVAVAFWVVDTAVTIAFVRPAVDRLATAVADSQESWMPPGVDALRWSTAWTWGGDVVAANDAAVLCLMTLKPGLTASLVLVLAANAAVAAIRLSRRIQRARPAPVAAAPEL